MMEDLATETVACIAEWRRIRKQQSLMAKMGNAIGVNKGSNDGQSELSEVLVKKGNDLGRSARAGSMPAAAPLYHKARFFMKAGATLSRKFAFHYEAIELRLAFKSVESYEAAERECKALFKDSEKLKKSGGDGGGISAAMSFRPGAKKTAGGDDVDLLLDAPLTTGEKGEHSQLTALLEIVDELKSEAKAARSGLGKSDSAVEIE